MDPLLNRCRATFIGVVATVLIATAAPAAPATRQAPDGDRVGVAASSARATRLVTFPGRGVTIRHAHGDLHKLRGTSTGLRHAVRRVLERMWRGSGLPSRCRTAPTVVVKAWRSDGWTSIHFVGMSRPCPSGGAWEIWRLHGSRHRVVIAGQDLPLCRGLERKHVPASMWTGLCYLRDRELAHYGPVFAGIAGTYRGEQRRLVIRADGRMRTVNQVTCCGQGIPEDVHYLLLRLDQRGGASAGVVRVEWVASSDPNGDPPLAGTRFRVTIADDVVRMRGATFCGPDADPTVCEEPVTAP